MHAVRAGCQRHIHPVIDNQRHPRRPQHGQQRARFRQHLAGAQLFFAQLHARDATRDRLAHQLNQRPPARQRAVSHQI